MKCKVCGKKTTKENDDCYICSFCLTEYNKDDLDFTVFESKS